MQEKLAEPCHSKKASLLTHTKSVGKLLPVITPTNKNSFLQTTKGAFNSVRVTPTATNYRPSRKLSKQVSGKN